MATFVVPNDFNVGDPIIAADHQQNWEAAETFINNSVIQTDGSNAFTGIPTGPSLDPVSNNQFTRKAYVDQAATSVVKYVELTTSGTTFGLTSGNTGLTTGAFTIPPMLPYQYLKLEFEIPRIEAISSGGGFPQSGGTFEFRLMQGGVGGTVRAFGQVPVSSAGTFDPDGAGSVVGSRKYTPAQVASGMSGSITLTLYGTVAGVATQGSGRIDGGPTTAAQITVSII